MFDLVLTRLSAIFDAIPFTSATWSVIGVLVLFLWLFGKASRDPKNPIKWEHLIVDSSNDRASPYKMGYLIGGLVSTWIVVSLADKGSLTYDVFGMYLTYLLGGAGVNTYFKSKGGESPFVQRPSYYQSQQYGQPPHLQQPAYGQQPLYEQPYAQPDDVPSEPPYAQQQPYRQPPL